MSSIFGRESVEYECPNCKSVVVTDTSEHISGTAWLSAFVMCTQIVCCLCSWIPLVRQDCKTTIHTCSECGAHLGRYRGEAECCY